MLTIFWNNATHMDLQRTDNPRMKPNARVIQQGSGVAHQTHPALAGSASEKRFANRRARKTPAHIVLDGQILGQQVAPISCLLKDTSSTGALIELTAATANRWSANSAGLPERFRLQIPSEFIEVDCRVAWREHEMLGVQFTAPARMLQKPQKPKPVEKPKSSLSLSRLFGG